ncbi:mitochondrial fission ELM1 family protein [Luteimonas terricola]|uniref:Nucleoside-diphosphate sugar epimerase n=1 Tax=Luteimonas terricola TaxID=645597 RepID=A0ABQ2E9A9_9GAMM|nr:ELM1/GtrOC1 family putative glycosyltransferase [Luteimonas terricola]GGJ98425.1 nucleoside-diphosphate sugar epimerase [Luteimonas terricola]
MILTATQGDARGVLALSDGRAGNARQAHALAAALAPAPGGLVLVPKAPWRWLAPRRLPGDRGAFGPEFAALLAAPPALAVGCGRQAALATRILRGRGARVVQLLDPRLPTQHWNLVVAPEHDGLRGGNVISLVGSLHPVDDAWLARARDAFPDIANLPTPRIAVLVGGPSAHAGFGVADFEALMAAAEGMAARAGGSLLVTASRRTPEAVRAALRARPRRVPTLAWVDAADGANPYAGLLAWADRIACTADSVNMLSEACATAAPVFVQHPGAMRGRPRRFIDALLARDRIRPLDAAALPFEVQPLRETTRVAAEVRARLGLR